MPEPANVSASPLTHRAESCGHKHEKRPAEADLISWLTYTSLPEPILALKIELSAGRVGGDPPKCKLKSFGIEAGSCATIFDL